MGSPVLYALACVLIPVAWGLAVVAVTNWLERRLRTSESTHDPVAQDDRP